VDEEDDALYLKAKEAQTIKGFIEALNIFAKYTDKGIDESFFCGAEHDELYMYVELEKLSTKSEDGKRLLQLGFHADKESGNWAYYT
jgi:hypothetical protein